MNVQRIPACVNSLVPTQMALMFVAALLVMCYALTRKHAQVIGSRLHMKFAIIAFFSLTSMKAYTL